MQEKTKAKQRYLRRKKERRKNKPKSKATGEPKSDGEPDEQEGESSSEEEESVADEARIELDVEESEKAMENPAKKRWKVVKEAEDVEMETVEDLPENESPPDAMDVQVFPETETSQPSLPSFPLPALPDAPSKSVLALQGLDQALVDAEIVNPAKLLPIPHGEADGGTGLSERMRKRLSDLGITELFAGMTFSHRA